MLKCRILIVHDGKRTISFQTKVSTKPAGVHAELCKRATWLCSHTDPHAHACFLRFAAGDICCGAAATPPPPPPPTRLTCSRTLHGSQQRAGGGDEPVVEGGTTEEFRMLVYEELGLVSQPYLNTSQFQSSHELPRAPVSSANISNSI